jgi:glycosyltransferase involved in cell wall biosynthesis
MAMSTSPEASQPVRKAPVSCYIRTLNEERLLKDVIDSALTVVDEVIIVDSGSTDRTLEIARNAGAKIVEQKWLGWGFQKRKGEEACRNDWLLDLDADEVVTPELARDIAALFANGEPSKPGWRFRLVTAPPMGRPWYNIRVVERTKLYDRRVLRMPEDQAWDQLHVPATVEIGELQGVLLHYSFRDIAQLVEKYNRGSSSMAKVGRKKKSRATIIFRILFGLPFYFFKAYVVRGLWRAGLYGLILAHLSAIGRWLRDAKMYEADCMEAEREARERHGKG